MICGRFSEAVRAWDWAVLHPRLAERPVRVDIGVACLALGPLADRRFLASRFATRLIEFGDAAMYKAKEHADADTRVVCLQIEGGELVETQVDAPASSDAVASPVARGLRVSAQLTALHRKVTRRRPRSTPLGPTAQKKPRRSQNSLSAGPKGLAALAFFQVGVAVAGRLRRTAAGGPTPRSRAGRRAPRLRRRERSFATSASASNST